MSFRAGGGCGDPEGNFEEIILGDGTSDFHVTVKVPFALNSLADADLAISSEALRLTSPGGEVVSLALPKGFAIDSDCAVAKYSRRRGELSVSSRGPSRPNGKCLEASSPEGPGHADSTPAPAAAVAVPDDEDDDDDLPPPLDAAYKLAQSVNSPPPVMPAHDSAEIQVSADSNEAADLMMEKALAARERKRLETEAARKKADMRGGGLKKGFFAEKPSKKKTAGRAVASEEPADAKTVPEDVPYIAPSEDKQAGLRLPEVQEAMRGAAKTLKEDQSWVTPQLMAALQSRPDLLQGISNPRVMEAMALMQSDPEAAQRKYKDDPEVSTFLKGFAELMATHFEVLGKSEVGRPSPAPETGKTQTLDSAFLSTLEPHVEAAFRDPEVQAVISALRAGQPLEMHVLGQQNPRLFQKVKVLLDAGLLGLQR